MKLSPPSRARATARVSLDTDCMMADTMGMESIRGQSSVPLRNFTRGVRRETLEGTQSGEV